MKKYLPLFLSGLFFIFGLVLLILPQFARNQISRDSTVVPNHPQVISASASSQLSSDIGNLVTAKVLKAIDGDTIELESGQRLRYIGIDTPETVDPRKPVQCFGKEASIKNKELVEGKTVSLERDVSEIDKFGRLLRYVFVNDVFVNDYLVRQGFAHSSSYPPDIKYQNQFVSAQKEAQEENRGLWSSCQSDGQVQTAFQEGCLIKGNISSSGEKIYHLPGQKFYDKTVIDTSKGEKWFCSEEEAQSAAWRKSKL